jgi:hypothetical protein
MHEHIYIDAQLKFISLTSVNKYTKQAAMPRPDYELPDPEYGPTTSTSAPGRPGPSGCSRGTASTLRAASSKRTDFRLRLSKGQPARRLGRRGPRAGSRRGWLRERARRAGRRVAGAHDAIAECAFDHACAQPCRAAIALHTRRRRARGLGVSARRHLRRCRARRARYT